MAKRPTALLPRVPRVHAGGRAGFTLVEMAVVVALLGTLTAMAIPAYTRSLYAARVARAICEVRALERDIGAYQAANGELPETLAALERGVLLDPWRNPYRYLKYTDANRGEMRKDRFLVPINSTYDLYSKGKNGVSVPPLTAESSVDDIIRANDGAFVGLASDY